VSFFVREEEIRARERGWGGDERRRRRASATAADIHFTGQRRRSKTSGPVVIDELTKEYFGQEYFGQEYFGHLACLVRSVDVAPDAARRVAWREQNVCVRKRLAHLHEKAPR
jgi:hypothetical protein